MPDSNAADRPVLELRGVSKSFGAVAAVQDVSFPLFAYEAHALIGENGAGKSTIVKMLAGVHRPDTGELLLDGAPLDLHSPADARAAGIETDDLAAAQAAMDRTDVNRRWQAEMAPFFADLDGTAPDRGMRVLPEIFNLEAQLEQAEHPGGSR